MNDMELQEIYDDLSGFGLVVLVGAVGFVVSYLLIWSLSKLYTKIQNKDASLLARLHKPIAFLFCILTLYWASQYYFETLSPHWIKFLKIIAIGTFSWLLIILVGIGKELLARQYDISNVDNLKARKVYTQIRVFERILIVLIVLLGTAFALMTFDSIRNFGASIIASAGIAGIIVGIAAQRLLANLLAGFQIAITQPIRLDDVVIVEKEWGWIEEITLTYVVVRIWDKRRLIVPSSHFIEKPFQNWTRTSADIMGTVFLYLDYQFPVDVLRQKFNELVEASPLWDGKVKVVQVTDLTSHVMEVRALVSAKDSPTAWDLRVYLREQLIAFLQSGYPQFLPRTRVELHPDEKIISSDKNNTV